MTKDHKTRNDTTKLDNFNQNQDQGLGLNYTIVKIAKIGQKMQANQNRNSERKLSPILVFSNNCSHLP